MAKVIAQRDLRNRNAEIVEAVSRGETFVVTRRGAPVAEIRPLAGGRRRLVPKAELSSIAKSGPHIDAIAFRADLDDAVDQRVT